MHEILHVTSRTQHTVREIQNVSRAQNKTVREILHVTSRTQSKIVREILHVTSRTEQNSARDTTRNK